MKISIKLLESDAEVSRQIFEEIKKQISGAILASKTSIVSEIKVLIVKSLMSEPEYQSLKSGILRAELGIQDVSTVDDIVNKLSETVELVDSPITISPKGGLKGGFKLVAVESETISGLISDTNAFVNDDIRGYKLPWLEWLLLKGGEKIIQNHEVEFGSSPYSRSGMAIMKESSSSWRVPPQFAGSKSNNWTTRALSKIDNDIRDIIISNIEKNL